MFILTIFLLVIVGGVGGYYGHSRWGNAGGAGIGLGGAAVILLAAYFMRAL